MLSVSDSKRERAQGQNKEIVEEAFPLSALRGESVSWGGRFDLFAKLLVFWHVVINWYGDGTLSAR